MTSILRISALISSANACLRATMSAAVGSRSLRLRANFNAVSNNTFETDSALRIFRNDFEQIAYNDDSYANRGEFQVDDVGTITGAFYRRDSRIVIFVEAGQNYFIQVESGQRYKRGEPALVDVVTQGR